ncbi:MAG: DUF1566 domain-containing protein [Gammaproteobacteria bacterium]|uniref:Lcl C-terminal domain-containing protein n=1 Tax=Pseudacidovorax sp. TaxID=1934311 RepID=UPI001B4A3073|nr:DUF1566 domain-containing protein [Pseudacidovorax sp.]MBP6894217.1 DUF1566 domain-containing protein [Pseudacidovorax sp.]
MPPFLEPMRALRRARPWPLLVLALAGCGGGGGGGGGGGFFLPVPETPLVLSMADSVALESGNGIIFTVKVESGPNVDKTITFTTADLAPNLAAKPVAGYARGGANCPAGGDYVAANGTSLRVPAGASSVTFAIPLCDDGTFQANKRFRVSIGGASNSPVAYGTILNDDAGGLNDTGIAQCYTAAGAAVACPASGLAGQDAEYGRDSRALTGGGSDGPAGFSYAKVSASGQAMASGASGWACVRDAVTGLMWQVQQGVSQPAATAFADVQAQIDAANTARLCGASDWRLPEVGELDSLVNAGRSTGVAATTEWFSDLAGLGNQARSVFWSNTTYPDDAQTAWVVDFSLGIVGPRNKADSPGNAVSLRLVSGGSAPALSSAAPCTADSAKSASDRYSTPGDGTVTDRRTQLMWAQCPQGQSGGSCESGSAASFSWSGALAQVAAANAAGWLGYSDWRLPNRNELASLVERHCRAPAFNRAYFPNSAGASYWSSSPAVPSAGSAWYVDFVDGDVAIADMAGNRRLRLVRAGQ